MIVEGVNFNDSLVRKMKKKDFVREMKSVFFQDRQTEERELLLSSVYDRIKGKSE